MKIARYNPDNKKEWDSFVTQSKNGTFLLCRDFMDYHSDRFVDYSLMFYEKNTLLAILPANIKDNILFSHLGLTYGGLILSQNTKSAQVVAIFDELLNFLKSQGISKLVYKAIPHIYHKYPSEEDLYALFLNKAEVSARSISSAIYNHADKPAYSQLRKRQIKKAERENVTVAESDDFSVFWRILEDNLRDNHNTNPVHSLTEINSLKNKFSTNIRLFQALRGGNVIAGCLVFETDTMAHIQYISANDEGKEFGALDFLFDKLITETFADKQYFDFGISTENGGQYLNEGLISQKEGFGARAIIYDTYTLNIK